MSEIATVIDTYLAAYCEPDKARRAEAVQRVWAPDARLIDPPLSTQGHAGIVDQADALLSQFPGHRFRRSSGIDSHNGRARYAWQLVNDAGQAVLEGSDYARLDGNGRLAEVTGFFGPLPAHERSAA